MALENEEDGYRRRRLYVSCLRLFLRQDGHLPGGQPDLSQIHDHLALRSDDAVPAADARRGQKARRGERRCEVFKDFQPKQFLFCLLASIVYVVLMHFFMG